MLPFCSTLCSACIQTDSGRANVERQASTEGQAPPLHPALTVMRNEGAAGLLPTPDKVGQSPLTPRSGVKRSTPEISGE